MNGLLARRKVVSRLRDNMCCSGCIWQDQCGCDKVCEYYAPWNEHDENERFIEENRYAFREEYAEYIEELC